jgi:hypothetical protein
VSGGNEIDNSERSSCIWMDALDMRNVEISNALRYDTIINSTSLLLVGVSAWNMRYGILFPRPD